MWKGVKGGMSEERGIIYLSGLVGEGGVGCKAAPPYPPPNTPSHLTPPLNPLYTLNFK